MPAAKVSYSPFPLEGTAAFPQGRVALRPYLTATLTGPSGEGVCCICLVDSGADECTFPAAFAKELGFKLDEMPREITNSSTGEGAIYYGDVRILVHFESRKGEHHDLEIQTRAGFMEGLNAHGIGLLGQAGFFDRVPVLFNQPEGTFTVYFTP